ncbi:SHOCT domain-containing protein [Aquibacillus salsiterrae]|uniref:SHOCT domain-containing protein n=1 Tax=Aquibacillus salsiterrae TaxID=2950439 RepID=A0A9X3WHR3_9BACI|nr:SHOCT domain-containing protein [Aquibacillus salsiterrae]MDC3418641.1 SHOCT domain-containing protein [Aquibacillus salsiterrae]
MMMGGGILSMLLWIIILGFVIYGIVLLVMKPFEKDNQEDKSILILKERYARGEIDEQEFEEKKAKLKD